jgi:hypothetical protein
MTWVRQELKQRPKTDSRVSREYLQWHWGQRRVQNETLFAIGAHQVDLRFRWQDKTKDKT